MPRSQRIALRGGRPRVTMARTIFFNARYRYRATDTVQVFSRAVAALQQPFARPKSRRLKVHVHVRVDRRGDEFLRFFPSDSTFISHRWQFARSFQGVFPPPHSIVKNTTTVFFFSTTEAERGRSDIP